MIAALPEGGVLKGRDDLDAGHNFDFSCRPISGATPPIASVAPDITNVNVPLDVSFFTPGTPMV
jgi:hypothetical protein